MFLSWMKHITSRRLTAEERAQCLAAARIIRLHPLQPGQIVSLPSRVLRSPIAREKLIRLLAICASMRLIGRAKTASMLGSIHRLEESEWTRIPVEQLYLTTKGLDGMPNFKTAFEETLWFGTSSEKLCHN